MSQPDSKTDSRTAMQPWRSIWLETSQGALVYVREGDLLGPVLKGMYACWAVASVLAAALTTDGTPLLLPGEGTSLAVSSASCSVACAFAVGVVIQRSCDQMQLRPQGIAVAWHPSALLMMETLMMKTQ